MATAELTEDGAAIELRCAHMEAELAALIPGARFDQRNDRWLLHLTWPACIAARGVFGANLHVGPRLSEWSLEARKNVDARLALRLMQDVEGMTGPTADLLRPLQRVGAYFMALAERAINGDDMGGGKTVQTIAAMKLARALDLAADGEGAIGPTMIVCPKKVKRVWAKHLAEWMPEVTYVIAGDTLKQKREAVARVAAGEADVLIINWDALPDLSRLERFGSIAMSDKEREPKELNRVQWLCIVADEAHRACDRKAKWTRAIKACAFGTPSEGTGPVRYRWALTGTPISNNSADMWSILNFTADEEFPAYSKHVDRYASTTWNRWGILEIGGINPATRQEYELAVLPRFIRRPRELLLPDVEVLPIELLHVQMAPKQKRAYKQMADEMLADLDGGVLMATSGMHRSNRLVQLALACGEMVDKGRRDEETGDVILDLQLMSPSCKVDAMLEIVDEAGGGSPDAMQIVFGAESRQLISLCQAALDKKKIPYSLLVGGQDDDEASEQERRFEAGETRYVLCTLQAACEGLNGLVAASTLVFLQTSWKRIVNQQFIGRLARDGQRRPVLIKEVITEDTVESWRREVLGDRDAIFTDVVRDEETLRAILTHKTA